MCLAPSSDPFFGNRRRGKAGSALVVRRNRGLGRDRELRRQAMRHGRDDNPFAIGRFLVPEAFLTAKLMDFSPFS